MFLSFVCFVFCSQIDLGIPDFEKDLTGSQTKSESNNLKQKNNENRLRSISQGFLREVIQFYELGFNTTTKQLKAVLDQHESMKK
jgi:hypothetical protein